LFIEIFFISSIYRGKNDLDLSEQLCRNTLRVYFILKDKRFKVSSVPFFIYKQTSR